MYEVESGEENEVEGDYQEEYGEGDSEGMELDEDE